MIWLDVIRFNVISVFGFEGTMPEIKFPVVMRLGETPLPIPNRTVKTQTAYDTWLATARESEWLPELF